MSDKENRWVIIKVIIENWWQPLEKMDGNSFYEVELIEQKLGVVFPEALREWYLMAGRREDINKLQDNILSLNELQIVNNVLVVAIENSFAFSWGIKLSDFSKADPPIFFSEFNFSDDAEEIGSFSFFITNIIAWLTVMFRPSEFRADGILNTDTFDIVKSKFEYIGYTQAWSQNKSQLFYRDNILVWMNEEGISLSMLSINHPLMRP